MAMEAARGVFVEEGLARHQWRRHGTCSGLSPSEYFAAVRTAREKVVIPPELRDVSAPRTTTAIELERAFVAANPGLRVDMMGVDCRGEVLQEVRVCMSRDLRGFVPCGEVDRRGCRARSITILPPR
jgi:ribonuclease T2